jgi:hypothetical protein
MTPYNLVMTSADITAAYGETKISTVPTYTLNYAKYGFTDLKAATIQKAI